jgi:hypothetical protein
MSDNVLQPNLDVLHESAIDLLTDISDTMAQGLDLIDRHEQMIEEYESEHKLDPGARDRIEEALKYVNIEFEKVKNLELRMAIVEKKSTYSQIWQFSFKPNSKTTKIGFKN